MPKGDQPCFNLSDVLAVFAARWKPEVLWHLRTGPRQFNELRRLLNGVSQKVLTQQLRDLERDGVLTRTVSMRGKVRVVVYEVSELGASIYPLLEQVYQWWDARFDDVERARHASLKFSSSAKTE